MVGSSWWWCGERKRRKGEEEGGDRGGRRGKEEEVQSAVGDDDDERAFRGILQHSGESQQQCCINCSFKINDRANQPSFLFLPLYHFISL